MPTPNPPDWILAIDDDPWALEMTSVLLGEHGWHVQRALDSQEAQAILARLGAPALVILDAMMPNDDGFAICRRLRNSGALQNVPIVFVTALDDEAIREAALRAGADDLLSKPVSASLLVTRVRTLIELHRHRARASTHAHYGIVLDTIGEGVVTVDEDDFVVEANRAAKALLGLPRDPLERIHLPSHVARHWSVVRGQVGRSNDARLLWQSSDGAATSAIDWTSRELSTETGEAWTLVVRDATDLWERDQALGRMMKSMSHKLRTPLTGLTLGIEFAMDYQTDPIAVEMLEVVQRSADRLHQTIVRMLEFVEASGPVEGSPGDHPEISPDELVASLGTVGATTVATTLTRQVRLNTDLVRRMVSELVANAVASGAGRIEIHVSPHPEGSVQFEITDDGGGIPFAAEARVFEPFYQLDKSGEQPGAGLGLSILRSEVVRAGGSTGTWSSPDATTTVWFRLPDHTAGPGDAKPDDPGVVASTGTDAETTGGRSLLPAASIDARHGEPAG